MTKMITLLLYGFLLLGCQGQLPSAVTPTPLPTPPPLVPTRTVGTGSGNLVVDGQALGIQPGEVIAIAAGTYKSLTFSSLKGTAAQPITLVATDQVEVVGEGLSLKDVTYLTLTGGAATRNLYLHDIAYRGITISGIIPDGLILEGIRLQNIGDYAVFLSHKTPYDGTAATALTGFKLLNCDFDNAGTVMIEGKLDNSAGIVNTGFCQQPEVAYCSFKNNPTAGTFLHIGNTEACNVHHNIVDNVNTGNNNHNGIFHLKGNGDVHHNKCTNHQGNFVRFWPFSQGNDPKLVRLYNNIIWNSRKYSALEVQSFQTNIIPGVSTFCNVQVFNNTAGKLNTTLPTVFVGVVIDVYSLMGGQIELVNNLSFDLVKSDQNDGIWSQQHTTVPILNSHNRYFPSYSAAGLIDLNEFRPKDSSPIKRAGLFQTGLGTDFYGTKRNNPPSIGAVD